MKCLVPLKGVLVIALSSSIMMLNAIDRPTSSHKAPKKGDHSILYQTSPNPIIPYKVQFANKDVDLDRLDMFERFDRELTSLIYGHSNTLLTLKRANRFFPIIIPILKEYGVPEDFVYLAAIESYFNLRAYSRANAAGIWQFLESTGRQYGLEVNDEVDERYDPEKATIAACKYLKYAYSKYGDWATVAASYNGGMGRISSELNKQLADNSFDLYLTEETSRYVFRIIAMKIILENPRSFGYNLTKEQLYQPIKYSEVEVSGKVESWSEWAKQYDISYLQLKELNPWIRSKSLVNKKENIYKVKIPLKGELLRSKRTFKVYNNNWVSR
ncbi:MAG: lytic transglycosylase domain-containing protein [Muribaculaceae bacterium]|nr:lytic transglycosylase domain-containing protein [Muribaculaceae bacterium]